MRGAFFAIRYIVFSLLDKCTLPTFSVMLGTTSFLCLTLDRFHSVRNLYLNPKLGYVRFYLNRHLGKFHTTSIPVPHTLIRTVRPPKNLRVPDYLTEHTLAKSIDIAIYLPIAMPNLTVSFLSSLRYYTLHISTPSSVFSVRVLFCIPGICIGAQSLVLPSFFLFFDNLSLPMCELPLYCHQECIRPII